MKKLIMSLMIGIMLAVPFFSLAIVNGSTTKDTETHAFSQKLQGNAVKTLSASANTSAWEITDLKVNGISGANAVAFEENTLEPVSTYENSEMQYKFVYSYNNGEEWKVISPMSKESSIKWTPKKVGSYDIYIDIMDETGKITTKTFNVTAKLSWDYTSVTMDINLVLGESYTIKPNVTGKTEGLSYKFVCSYNNGTEWSILQNTSTTATAVFTPKKTGNYEIFVDILDKNDNVITKSIKVTAATGWSYSGISGVGSNITVGDTITLNPIVTGRTTGLSYKFVYSYNNWSNWGVIQPISSNATATYTLDKPGTYEFYIDITDKFGNVATKSVKTTSTLGWSYSSISGVGSNITVGETITLKPTVTGKTTDLSYKFVYSYNNWSEWGVIQPVGSNATATYTPNKLGEYEFYVDITDKFGNVVTNSVKTTSILGWSFDSISGVNTSLTVGNTITLKPTVTGKTTDLSYKFVYSYNNWSEWGVIQPVGSNATATYTIDKAGSYEFFVDITDKNGNIVTKSVKTTTKLGWSFDSISGVNSSITVGEAITLKPKVTGNTAGLSYKFVYFYNDWNKWGIIQPMSISTTATYTPDKAGIYDIYVDISDKYGNVVTKSIKATSKFAWSYDSLTHGGNPTMGESTNVTANISGKNTGLRYKFVYSYDNWADWGVFQNLSTNATAIFTPKKPGKYDIYVDVCDAYGNVITKSVALTVAADWEYKGITLSATDVEPGNEITITPKVTGNTSQLKYKFVASYMNGTSWSIINSFSSASSAKYRITNPGYYDIYVDIMDGTGYTVTKSVRVTSAGGKIPVLNQDWFSVVKSALPSAKIYTVVDVWTGKRFQIRSLFGTNHLDSEPLTANDTAVIKQVYGGKFSWDRRPVVVINGLKAYAGSMNGMPHEEQTITNNGFEGHFCIHFLNSKTHGSDKVDSAHQKAVNIAAGIGSIKLE